jgi:two-component system catabolic regulation response regulator CreB
MAKPFSPRELTARVRAVLRRVNGELSSGASQTGGSSQIWTHDVERCRISYRGRPLELTRNEYRLLSTFIAQPGRVFSRDQLMAAAWDDPGAALDRTVDAHVKMLRAKVSAAVDGADPILTHRGLGYSLREEV